MARGRMIHTQIWRSEKFSEFGLRERLLWIGLITNADDQGRGQAHPNLVRSDVFPLEDVPIPEIVSALEAFQARDMLILYRGDDKHLYQVVNWWEYQGAMSWAWPSKYPPPDGWTDRIKYRKGNTVMEENWTLDGGKEDAPSDDDGPTVTPPRPYDDTALGQAPNTNGKINGSQNGKGNINIKGGAAPSGPVPPDDDDDDASLLSDLIAAGMTDRGARAVLEKHDPDRARGWIAYVRDNGKIQNPGGYLWKMLVDGSEDAPPPPRAPPDDRTSRAGRNRYAVPGVTMPIEEA